MNQQIPRHWVFPDHARALAFTINQELSGFHCIMDTALEDGNEVWTVDLYVDDPKCPDCGYIPQVEPHHGSCPSLSDEAYEIREDLRHG